MGTPEAPTVNAPGARARRLPRRRLIGSALALAALTGIAWARGRSEPRRPRGSDRPPGELRSLRPPGALPEPRFASACVRFGLCVQACPYDTLRLAPEGGPVAPGTPYFVARETPCYMCDGVPCRQACPTGALGDGPLDIRAARIGLAGLIRPEGCYSFIGAAICNSCVKACPLKGRAI